MWANTYPKARIKHECGLCGRTIHPGETYRRAVNLDGTAYTWKECEHCAAFALNADIGWGEEYDSDSAECYEPTTWEEARWCAGYRKRWRTRNGNLLPVPGALLDGEGK